MGKILRVHELPSEEKVYLKKDFLGYRVVEPIIDPETKKIVWKNVFSKRGLMMLGFVVLLLSLFYLAYNEQINNYKQVTTNPCAYCNSCQEHTREILESTKFNSQTPIQINFTLTK